MPKHLPSSIESFSYQTNHWIDRMFNGLQIEWKKMTYFSPFDELRLTRLYVIFLRAPGFDSTRLKSPTITKGQSPRLFSRKLIDCTQVYGRLLFWLTPRKEYYPWKQKISLNVFKFNDRPGTAVGTVRCKAVTVALATSWGVYFFVQPWPAVTIFGFNRVPSRKTLWSLNAL